VCLCLTYIYFILYWYFMKHLNVPVYVMDVYMGTYVRPYKANGCVHSNLF